MDTIHSRYILCDVHLTLPFALLRWTSRTAQEAWSKLQRHFTSRYKSLQWARWFWRSFNVIGTAAIRESIISTSGLW